MKYKMILTLFLCMAVLAGCSGKKVNLSGVTESTIGVNADGSVSEAVIEAFDKDYYSLSELTDFVNEEVDQFNKANPQKQPENQKADAEPVTAVTVRSVEVDSDEKTARLELDYLNMDIYNAFNGTKLQFLTVEEAISEGSMADIGLVSVKTGESAAFSDIDDPSKLHVVCSDGPARIRTGGKIMYYSRSVSLLDDNTAEMAEGESVIVFK